MTIIKKLTLLFILLCSILNTNAQHSLNFNFLFKKEKLKLPSDYYLINEKDSLQFTTIKFYISDIEFYNNEEKVYTEPNSYHLIDPSDTNTLKIRFNTGKTLLFNSVKFNVGIDSATNCAGILEGDLDPLKGMYWTWQSGYVNFKLEGKSNLCQTRNNEFTYHLGGYMQPFYSLQIITIKDVKNLTDIKINIDLDKWINTIDLKNKNSIMSPSEESQKLSIKLPLMFSLSNNEK